MLRLLKRSLLFFILLLLLFLGRPILHLAWTAWKDPESPPPAPEQGLDDASHLEWVDLEILDIPPGSSQEEAEQLLQQALLRAKEQGRYISIGGSRHSMGGHSLHRGSLHIRTRGLNAIQYDPDSTVLQVGAGALWSDILAHLDPLGRSVKIMQSNHSFSVGGSISANCHGWAFPSPPIASSVLSFRILLADGRIIHCSREEHEELFRAALGGYGLFGLITEVRLETVPNRRLQREQWILPSEEILTQLQTTILTNPEVELFYGRFDISRYAFMEQVILSSWQRDPAGVTPDPIATPAMRGIRRAIFRGSVGSDYGKRLRWSAETRLQPKIASPFQSRNSLFNESVEVFANHQPGASDILHEYFVPLDQLTPFIHKLQELLPHKEIDLLNVTLRHVEQDKDSLLRYAKEPCFALVMLFHQKHNKQAEAAMQALTQELIDAALDCGGSYYLPYRLHASQTQFERAYPDVEAFKLLKQKLDPEGLFRNQFYEQYLSGSHR